MFNRKKTTTILIILSLIIISCSNQANKKNEPNSSNDHQKSSTKNSSSNDDENDENSCKLTDGTYSATVDYNNPETGYSQTYTLEVDVEDCQVVQINFPKGGWLDEDHIDAAEIDEDGNASVSGENGKTYEVHIDN